MDGGLVLFVPAAGAGFRIGPRHPIEAATEAVTECASLAAGGFAENILFIEICYDTVG
jgi:hypothetical protein